MLFRSVTFVGSKITDTKNLTIGVADLLNNFDRVNEKYSGNTVEEMEQFVTERLDELNLDKDYDGAGEHGLQPSLPTVSSDSIC